MFLVFVFLKFKKTPDFLTVGLLTMLANPPHSFLAVWGANLIGDDPEFHAVMKSPHGIACDAVLYAVSEIGAIKGKGPMFGACYGPGCCGATLTLGLLLLRAATNLRALRLGAVPFGLTFHSFLYLRYGEGYGVLAWHKMFHAGR